MIIHWLVSVSNVCTTLHWVIIAIFPTVPPSRPENLRILEIGSSWTSLQWECPSHSAESSSIFSHYEITVIDSRDGIGNVSYFSPEFEYMNISFFNLTNLQHETLYEFSVTAVSKFCGILARSLSSNLVHSTTKPQGITIFQCRYIMHLELNLSLNIN